MDSFNFVLFGFTSNLAQIKIIPALYELENEGLLNRDSKIIGIGRKPLTVSSYYESILQNSSKNGSSKISQETLQKLISKTQYIQNDVQKDEEKTYLKLTELTGNTLYYLSTYPALYSQIFTSLKKFNLNKESGGRVRIMIEKPFGHDLISAIQLGNLLHKYFDSKQVFRVDHFLGKEDIRKLFSEKISSKNVDNIQISMLEDFGIEKRGGYYDDTGALLDVGQNHVLQMFNSIVKNENTIRSREEVLVSLVPNVNSLVMGQYEGYLTEQDVKENSNTDTFFALNTSLSKGEWKNIPIYLRSGKKLSKNETKISVVYKNGIVNSWIINSSSAHRNLILEAIKGDQLYFNSQKEIELQWKFIDQLVKNKPKPLIYEPGSNGPKEAEDLMQKDGREWV